MRRLVTLVSIVALVLVPGYAVAYAQSMEAVAQLLNTAGEEVGTARFVQMDQGVRVQVAVNDLDPGAHGVHIHAVGDCTPPFSSAGGHFNPTGQQHGLQNPAGPHAGDLPNLMISSDRSGTLDVTNPRVTLSAGPNSVFDGDGSALVIHAGADDEQSDPAGNSGDRVACGVISAVNQVAPQTGAPRDLEITDSIQLGAAILLLLLAFGFMYRAAHRPM